MHKLPQAVPVLCPPSSWCPLSPSPAGHHDEPRSCIAHSSVQHCSATARDTAVLSTLFVFLLKPEESTRCQEGKLNSVPVETVTRFNFTGGDAGLKGPEKDSQTPAPQREQTHTVQSRPPSRPKVPRNSDGCGAVGKPRARGGVLGGAGQNGVTSLPSYSGTRPPEGRAGTAGAFAAVPSCASR